MRIKLSKLYIELSIVAGTYLDSINATDKKKEFISSLKARGYIKGGDSCKPT